ncbi:unnamed protein product [Miscanthus lutarioriparius]|uniref:Uncharacterized protein n=1 Tax=Miscanthus lutarioriparius TaxID=422564 RepID=A0A811MHM0_9POAL|nr:unnamed protein product [Miscanthus lutarioriparius]
MTKGASAATASPQSDTAATARRPPPTPSVAATMQCGMRGDSATLLVIYGVSVRFLKKLMLMMTYEVVISNPSDSEGESDKERKGKDQIVGISQIEESHQAPKLKG